MSLEDEVFVVYHDERAYLVTTDREEADRFVADMNARFPTKLFEVGMVQDAMLEAFEAGTRMGADW